MLSSDHTEFLVAEGNDPTADKVNKQCRLDKSVDWTKVYKTSYKLQSNRHYAYSSTRY